MVDVVSVVREDTAIAFEITDGRGCCNDILETGLGLHVRRHEFILSSRKRRAGSSGLEERRGPWLVVGVSPQVLFDRRDTDHEPRTTVTSRFQALESCRRQRTAGRSTRGRYKGTRSGRASGMALWRKSDWSGRRTPSP